MPPSRSIIAGGLPLLILRPLLGLYRRDVESYLKGRGLSWRRDSTNSDERFLRNRLRAKLVPLLDGEFPGWRRGLETLGDTQSLAAAFIGGEARRRLPWEWADSPSSGGGRELRNRGFFDQPPIIREEALFQGLNLFHRSGSPSVPRRRNLRRFARGEIRDLDLGFCRIAADPAGVSIFRRQGGAERGFSLLIKGPGLYKLKGITGVRSNSGLILRVWERGKSPSAGLPEEEGGFFAALPLVLRPFRSGREEFGRLGPKNLRSRGKIPGMRTKAPSTPIFQDMILAQDAAGPAALIGFSPRGAVILWKQETRGSGDFFFCGIGGIDA
jgi:tRNA(Ile)-lysidine synthase